MKFIPPQLPSQDILDDYHDLVDALSDADFDYLEDQIAKNPDFLNTQDGFLNRHVLTRAIQMGTLDVIRWVLERGANPNFWDDEGYSPLKTALENDSRDCSILKLLIEYGADVKAEGTLDHTVLHRAATLRNWNAVRILMEAGANPHAYDLEYEPYTPIMNARFSGDEELAVMMEKFKPQVSKSK